MQPKIISRDKLCITGLSGEGMKMDLMINLYTPYVIKAGAYKDENETRITMSEYFPRLKRWAK